MQIHDIQRAVAEAFDIPETAMISPQRRREWARPRQVAMYLCYDVAGYSLARIARAFNRDRSTVHHGVQAIRKLRPTATINGVLIVRVIADIARCIRNDNADALNYRILTTGPYQGREAR